MSATMWGLIVLVLLLVYFWTQSTTRYSKRRRRHRRNIRKARKTLRFINSMKGSGRAARVLLYLRKIDPYVFEELILEAYASHGYSITRNHSYSGDGGLDGQVVDPQGIRYLVQAKRYAGIIRSSHLEEFAALVRRHQCQGLFVHTGRTPKAAIRRHPQVKVVSGSQLVNELMTKR